MRPVAAFCLLAASCGRIGFDIPARVSDAGASDGASIDAAALRGFDPPNRIDALSDPADDDDPSVTGDLLELYFASQDRPGGEGNDDIWVSKRDSVEAPWPTPEPVAELNTGGAEENPGVSRDGLTLWFSRGGSVGSLDLWVATREARGAPWSEPTHVPELSSPADDLGPELSADRLRIYFYTSGGAGGRDLFFAERDAPDAPWGSPQEITELNTADDDLSPFPVRDERLLFFSSSRSDGAGARDLYVGRRADRDAAFTSLDALEELNTPAREDDPWVADDFSYLVLASDRDGDLEIYEAFAP